MVFFFFFFFFNLSFWFQWDFGWQWAWWWWWWCGDDWVVWLLRGAETQRGRDKDEERGVIDNL